MKKALCIILAIVMMCSCVPITALAAESEQVAALYYDVYDYTDGVKSEKATPIKEGDYICVDVSANINTIYLVDFTAFYDGECLEAGYFSKNVWNAAEPKMNNDIDLGTELPIIKTYDKTFIDALSRVAPSIQLIRVGFFVEEETPADYNGGIFSVTFKAKKDIDSIYDCIDIHSNTFIMSNADTTHNVNADCYHLNTLPRTYCTDKILCADCGNVINPAGSHTLLTREIGATCTEEGKTISYCNKCSYESIAATTPKLGHSYDDGVITTESTCTQKGVKAYTCTRCGDSYSDEIEALGHDYETVVTAPTCTEGGYTTFTCTRCGDTYTAYETAALGHKVVVDKAVEPTFKKTGKTSGKHCSVCGKVIVVQKKVAKLASPKLASVKAGKKQFKATWKKVASIDGYQIQYSTSSAFKKGNKTVNVSKSATSKTVKKLKAKTKYYVRIRAFKKINGKKVYSSWSKSKSAKTKA